MPSITELPTTMPKAAPAPKSAADRAKAVKDAGNEHFKRKEWAEAVGPSPCPALLQRSPAAPR